MKIWILDCDVDNYENLVWDNLDIDFIRSFDGRSKIRQWTPVKVRRMYHREFSNSPGLSPNIPVVDGTATAALMHLIQDDAELLPLDYDDGQFYALNTTTVLDCINHEKSEYKTFRDGKRIMRFTKYSFDEEKTERTNIFRIKELPLGRPFVTDAFKNCVEENNLSGFEFELVWDGEKEI